ncbi:MAG: hypothetical protein LBN07_00155 [Christensenellaceae bacterium]|jgi:sporulation protein YabP|nr:hypothetical protein [Christensenellaceae bacterium]
MPEETKKSELKLVNRTNLSVTGLEKVIGANESRICIVVSGCMLNIFGMGMHVDRLDVAGGFIDIAGQINELKYTAARDKTNFFKRLVK